MKTRIILFTACFLALWSNDLKACTTAVISGKFTVDGRPLLWKNRDADALDNKLMYFTDGKYDYMALVNSEDKEGKEVWIGMNAAGFAIMNSASYNLNESQDPNVSDREGIFMKWALQNCATVDEFSQMLDTIKKPYGVEANFGVIDANGGAAYFETSNAGYVKIDVNDPAVAPMGYLIRTNYSFTGFPDKGHGYIRYLTAEKLFYNASAARNLSVEFLVQDATRCLYHSLTDTDLKQTGMVSNPDQPKFVWFADYIPRFSTSTSTVVQGVNPSQNVSQMTMWTVLGFPLCSVVYPTWFNDDHILPGILKAVENGNAPLCDKAMALKNRCYSIQRGHGEDYINLNALYNSSGTGIMQKLKPLENYIFTESFKMQEKWKGIKPPVKEIQSFYQQLDQKITGDYKTMFGL